MTERYKSTDTNERETRNWQLLNEQKARIDAFLSAFFLIYSSRKRLLSAQTILQYRSTREIRPALGPSRCSVCPNC